MQLTEQCMHLPQAVQRFLRNLRHKADDEVKKGRVVTAVYLAVEAVLGPSASNATLGPLTLQAACAAWRPVCTATFLQKHMPHFVKHSRSDGCQHFACNSLTSNMLTITDCQPAHILCQYYTLSQYMRADCVQQSYRCSDMKDRYIIWGF